MKLTKVFGIVLSLHVAALMILLAQPGCQTIKGPNIKAVKPETRTTANNAPKPVKVAKEKVAPQRTENGKSLFGFFSSKNSEPVAQATKPMAPKVPVKRYKPTKPQQPLVAESMQSDEVPVIIETDNQLVESAINDTPITSIEAPRILEPISLNDQITNNFVNEIEENYVEYTIKKGDSLWRVSKKFSTTVEKITKINGLYRNSILRVGQIIKLPGDSVKMEQLAPIATNVAPTFDGEATTYTVKAGDNLGRIAKSYGVSVKSIKSANNLRSDTIRIKQKLLIPGGSKTPLETSFSANPSPVSLKEGQFFHIVARGDSISKIALKYGVRTKDILKWNNIQNAHAIQLGQKIAIQKGEASSSSNVQIEEVTVEPVLIEPVEDTRTITLPTEDFSSDFFDQEQDIPNVPIIEHDNIVIEEE